jgi:uncharacterized protein (UPF0332 family)
MTFDPNEFLNVANKLAQNAQDEASLRTAVGRAYYSVFLQACEKLGIQGRRRRVHGFVIGRVRHNDPAAGNQLAKLEALRGEADYQLTVSDPLHRDWRSNWRQASNYAMHIVKRLQRL